MSIIILGSNGMLGSMLYFIIKTKYKHLNVNPVPRSAFDVLTDNISKLDTIVSSGSIVVNCIGAIPQKKYSDEDYTKLNTTFPQELSLYCKHNDIQLIHVSTNCVFSGNKDMCYETDKPDADDKYGQSKQLGEPEYGLVIRCSIIGPEKHTFCGLLEWFLNNNNNEVNGFTDSFWNGLTTLELSKIIIDYIENKPLENSMIHYYSENTLSKYEILEYINSKFNRNKIINKKQNGLKYYTLCSNYSKPRTTIEKQIDELFTLYNEYKHFYGL
jgi:dTDP-4-dehydrorhamnose reductase